MNTEWLLAFVLFAFSTAGTPGPNNIMLAANAANHGLKRTAGAILGVSLGFAAMIATVGLGLGWLFRALPWLSDMLKWAGAAWLLYLAWKIFSARPATGADSGGPSHGGGAPLTFWHMAAFQWVNPKAWSMVLAMMGVYAGKNSSFHADMLTMAALFAIIGTITATSWALLGHGLGKVLSGRGMVWFNRFMALLLLASIALMI